MSRGFIVDDMINETRSLVDEFNEHQLDDVADILPSLNRAQEKAVKVLSRIYPDPIMQYVDVVGPSTREIDIPENIWEDKISRMEWISTTGYVQPKECQHVGLRLLSQHDEGSQNAVAMPDVYAIVGRKIRFNGRPNGIGNLRIWYLREIDQLVKSVARVTDLVEGSETLYLGEVSAEFDPFGSVTYGDWNSYVNVVDGQTGTIKGTFQIKAYNGADTLELKTVPDRSIVLNRDVSTTLVGANVSADDYICSIRGTCVQYFLDSFHAFCVQYTVAELKRKLGYAYDVDQQLIKDFEAELTKTHMGRSPAMRIKNNNPNWLKGSRRRFYRGFKY